jgi:hypothetical protein
VVDNLHKIIPKTLMQRTLDDLVRDGSVKCKEYGKCKIYHYSQENVAEPSKEEMVKLDVQIKVGGWVRG